MFDYTPDVLRSDDRHRREIGEVMLRRGLVVEVPGDGFVGAVTAVRGGRLVLEDRRGRERTFALDGTFLVEDRLVRLLLPQRPVGPPTASETASGSTPVAHAARVARASRILVEGVHDAELVERVWGADLRVEGIVVEPIGGIDNLQEIVRSFAPAPQRRLGILVDHLVPGSKEQRVAASVAGPDVLVTGHPFVDVWAGVKPAVAGIGAWPDIPRGVDWKTGVCAALGEPDPRALWRRLLGSVNRYTDLDRALVGAVEELIDFVTAVPER